MIVHHVMTDAFKGLGGQHADLGPALACALEKRERRLAKDATT
jgi:hypothetical protein